MNNLLRRLSALNSITIEIQSDSTSLVDARYLFDGQINKYPSLKNRLSSNADIVENETFECAVAKIQDGKEESLSLSEQRAVRHLLKNESVSRNEVDTSRKSSLTFA